MILNACDPRLNQPIFAAALDARCTCLDMAMTLSRRHPEAPFERTGVMLGDEQFAAADLVVEGNDFAPTFSIWTTIEECLNPPLVRERERGFYTTAPFSEPELFELPEDIGEIECVNVEPEEVVLIPRTSSATA